jgi:hypothetical protein
MKAQNPQDIGERSFLCLRNATALSQWNWTKGSRSETAMTKIFK